MRCLLLVNLVAAAVTTPRQVTPQYQPFDERIPEPQYLFENHNPEFTDDGLELFESDMVLTEEQRADRKAAANLWPGGAVKFAITSSSTGDRTAIEAGLNHWREHSCVTFTEVAESYGSGPHLRFTKQSGCWSYVGRINRNSGQEISIGSGCTGLGTIVHEIGHALGFNHEQARPDRDTYVTIITANIQSGKEGNFAVRPSANNYSVPYDLTSVMHYGSTYFTSNGLPTIAVNELQYSGLIGNRVGLSHRDKQLANLMYQCAADCNTGCNGLTCENGGYVNKDCTCTCSSNTAGTTCQTLNGPYYTAPCGDQSITSPGTITSLNYPQIYPPNKTCFWIITAPTGQRVRIQFGIAKVLYRRNGRCYWDWINLYNDADSVAAVNACGTELQNQSHTSTGNWLAVEMRSYAGGNYPSLQTGFTGSVTFI